MLGWLFGGCPVDPAAKEWIEERLLWLRDEFGADDLYADNYVAFGKNGQWSYVTWDSGTPQASGLTGLFTAAAGNWILLLLGAILAYAGYLKFGQKK